MGIDHGSKRIGVAMSDPLRIIAQGLCAVENSPGAMDKLDQIVREYQPEKIVVGMPFNLKGEKGVKAIEVEEFISVLRHKSNLEVIPWDERFTSKVAHQTLRDMNVKKKSRRIKENIDAMAAALILQSYLDSHR